jgi:diguanylate cyclase (GGDEF)-like protein/PAS domain S-box-containing protein
MRDSLESYMNLDQDRHADPPLPRSVWAIGIVVMALLVAYYAAMFPAEYRHPIDDVDVVRESVNFFGALLVAVWARRDVRPLNYGFVSLLLSLWMEVVDEFTAEPLWQGTFVPAVFGIGGIMLIAVGVREAARRRAAESRRRAAAEEALRHSLSTQRAVVESTPDAVWVKGKDGRFLLANSAFATLVGKSEEAIVGRSEAELFAAEPDAPGRAVGRALESGVAERFEATVAGLGSASRTFLVSRSAFNDASGRAIGVLGVARDISDRKAVEDRLVQQAHHDALTGLANRAAFMEHLTRALSRWQHRPEKRFAVLFLDIDRFKDVNDRYGHAVGDELLVAFAAALGRWLRPEDFLGRLGGDEFTVLLHEVAGPNDAVMVADRIVSGLKQPFLLGVGPVSITASVGVAISSADLPTADLMLRTADAAMYRAKELGRAPQSKS